MENRTRIARVIARMNVGGPARLIVGLNDALNDTEFESTLIIGTVAPGEQDMTDLARSHGAEPVIFREMSREIAPADLLTLWKLYRFFRKYRPHIVETHTAKAGAVGRTAAFLYRWLTPGALIGRPRLCRSVHFYHGHVFRGYYGRFRTALFLGIERLLARTTDRIIVPSQQQLEEMTGRFGVGKREQFRVAAYGLPLNEFVGTAEHRRAGRERLGIGDGEIIVGIVGRLAAIKNHEMFLRVAARFAALGRSGICFVIFGVGGDREMLEERVRSLGLSNVRFAGFTDDARELYAALDVIALTSRNEGMPLTLIEAMANGKPVVATAVGGVVDLLGPVVDASEPYQIRQRGITVPSEDDAAFAAALSRILDDAELREALAARGRAHVFAAHGTATLTEAIAQVYRELE